MRKRNRDLGFFLLLACGNLIYALLPIRFLVWQCIIAGALVFFVPGYLLQEILVQKQMYDMIWRLLVSVGLSLSIDIMSGFLLNVLPEGLTGRTWGLWLSGLTIVGVVFCLVKRRRWQLLYREGVRRRNYPPCLVVTVGILAVCLVISIFISTANMISSQSSKGFTQFWLLLKPPGSCTVQLGIQNNETGLTEYEAVVKVNDRLAGHWSVIRLQPQQQWEQHLALSSLVSNKDSQPTHMHVEANLYRVQAKNYVYRTVQLFLVASRSVCTQPNT
jgi:uncharacterized membrane protein